jgi:hypothetical protein
MILPSIYTPDIGPRSKQQRQQQRQQQQQQQLHLLKQQQPVSLSRLTVVLLQLLCNLKKYKKIFFRMKPDLLI